MRNWLKGLLQVRALREHPLFDGTISELANTLYIDNVADADRYADMIEPHGGKLGYVQMRVREFKTRDVEAYAEIVNDADRWQAFDAEVMDRYFRDHIDLFPFRPGRSRAASGSGRRASDEAMALPNPEAFHLIQKDMIERRFAGGEVTDIGERDLRDAISGLRHLFVRNFWHLVLSRRSAALTAVIQLLTITAVFFGVSLAGLALMTDQLSALWLVGAAFAASAVLTALVWINTKHLIGRHSEEYANAIQATCNALSRGLSLRLHDLIAVIPLFFHRIEKSKMELKNANRLNDWPVEVKKWTKLAFWIDARVQHIELYMQVQMWRIRRMHYGIRWLGSMLSRGLVLVGALPLMALAAVGVWTLLQNDPSRHALIVAGLFGLFAVLAALVAFDLANKTFRMQTPDIDIIEKTLKTKAMQGYRDVRLHEQMADFSFQEKMSQLHEEEKLKR